MALGQINFIQTPYCNCKVNRFSTMSNSLLSLTNKEYSIKSLNSPVSMEWQIQLLSRASIAWTMFHVQHTTQNSKQLKKCSEMSIKLLGKIQMIPHLSYSFMSQQILLY